MMQKAYLGLGSNMGDREDNLARARAGMAAMDGVHLLRVSSVYQTAPWGRTDQEDFLNQVVEIETDLKPLQLLHKLQELEIKLGRRRGELWGPRVIDLDVLLYGRESIVGEKLTVPHPFMAQRLFVLVPLAEIAPEALLPDGSTIREVLSRAESRLDGNRIQKL
jgi:2-amino-4-hydroxy-6-hydroxymethyldihydropteridine diphosphokinase